MEYYAGIDGGGTRTSLLCRCLEGKDILSRSFGPFNLNSIGEEAFLSLLSSIADCLREAGRCRHLVIGAAGASNPRMKELIDSVFLPLGLSYELVGDHVIALEGAHGGGAGLALISGTGSICFGKGEDGRIERSGGWGHVIGDEGSAYALARDALVAVAHHLDGAGPMTVLTHLFTQKGLVDRSAIISFVYSSGKDAIASLSPLVDEAYRCGDDVAVEIVRHNAELLSHQLESVAMKLGLEETHVAFFGGLVDKATPFRDCLIESLSSLSVGISYREALYNAVVGAVMLARTRSGK